MEPEHARLLPWKLDEGDSSLVLLVKVIPGVARTLCAGLRQTAQGPALLMRVAAAPEKGKANDELVAWLSGTLSIPRSQLQILSGQGSRLKRISLPAACASRLSLLLGEAAG